MGRHDRDDVGSRRTFEKHVRRLGKQLRHGPKEYLAILEPGYLPAVRFRKVPQSCSPRFAMPPRPATTVKPACELGQTVKQKVEHRAPLVNRRMRYGAT
jgi:hypothetical protein